MALRPLSDPLFLQSRSLRSPSASSPSLTVPSFSSSSSSLLQPPPPLALALPPGAPNAGSSLGRPIPLLRRGSSQGQHVLLERLADQRYQASSLVRSRPEKDMWE